MTGGPRKKSAIPLIGMLAVKNRLITQSELSTGLSQCRDTADPHSALVDYFLSRELISKKNIKRLILASKAISIRHKEFKFGAIAVSKGFINKSVLNLALEEQEEDMKKGKKPRLIGDMMVDAGMITENQRDTILQLQKRPRKALVAGDQAVQGGPRQDQDQDSADTSQPAQKEENLPETPEFLDPEIIYGGIQLQVSGDLMAAFLTKTPEFDASILVADVKDALFVKGIISGLAADEMISGFINSSGFKTKSFRVANGVRPIQGKDAKIEFFFNTDYLKAGGMDENGNIDFKQRGEIPLVEKDTVLAEKTPRIKARSGLNIFGEEVGMAPAQDKALRFGKGAVLSEDGRKLLAGVRGYPKFSLGGVVFVNEEYTTGGDVDFETGHIEFDGNVNIKGCIKSGFKVKGNDVHAIELDGGVVDADGDVKVDGGINEGRIYARGNVYAKFILASEIVCMGDVYVEKEIVDSTVECSGACSIVRGKLISSKISTKMGLSARNIGTQMASPSVIKVGFDVFAQKELALNNDKTSKLKEEISKFEEKKREAVDKGDTLQKEISELAYIQDRSQLERGEINRQLNDSAGAGAPKDLTQKLAVLEKNVKQAEARIDNCFAKSDEYESLVENFDRKIKKLKEDVDYLAQERHNLSRWSKDNPGKSQVAVDGAVLSGNTIIGKHSELTVDTMIRHARIIESLVKNDAGKPVYQMTVGNY